MFTISESDIADQIWSAYQSRVPCSPVREQLGSENIAGAYRIQWANAKKRITEGASHVGFKVGMTSKVVQEQLGYFEPNYGHLFDTTELTSGANLSAGSLIAPKAEAEIAFVLSRGLTTPKSRIADVNSAIDFAVCAIELLDSRIINWDIGPVDSIADNGSGGAHVLGSQPQKVTDFDLRLSGMVSQRNGEIAALGVGAASMGNPILAIQWLANILAETDRPLRAGDVILSGALGPIVDLEPGDAFGVEIAGLGSVDVSLAAND